MNALILTVALILTGECGPVGNGCEFAVARTIANRIGAPGFGATLSETLTAYYGHADEPSAEALRVARLLWMSDLSDGKYYFAYSDQDRRRMGWRKGDAVICGSGLCLNLSATWPGS